MKKKVYVVIFGDSIVSCSLLKQKKRWTEILKKKFNKKYKNLFRLKTFSFNGATTNDAIVNFKKAKLNKKVNFIIFMFGINDSVYWISKKGKPRVSLNIFKNNISKLVKKTNKHCDAKIAFMLAHKFFQNRFEGNKKTHNFNYQKYRNAIIRISKLYKTKIIDMHSKLIPYPSRKYCLPLPDGLHLNNFGSLKYSQFIYKFIIKEAIRKS